MLARQLFPVGHSAWWMIDHRFVNKNYRLISFFNPFPEIYVFHIGKGERGIKTLQFFKKCGFHGHITRPQQSSAFIDGRSFQRTSDAFPAHSLSFQHLDIFSLCYGIQESSKPALFWQAVIVCKNKPAALGMSCPIVSVCCWPLLRPCYPTNPGVFLLNKALRIN